jgi:hypothetical protein
VSPEYTAVTAYEPAGSVVVEHDAWPEATDAEQSVSPAEVKVTLPVAAEGRPEAERATVLP